jgi:hypothetical protein
MVQKRPERNQAMQHGDWPAAYREAEIGTACTGNSRATPDPRCGFDDEVAELAVLLTSGEATALECAAHVRGMTVAQLLRCLIRECLARPVAG